MAGHDRAVFSFEYRLVGSGWSEGTIRDDEAHATLTASHLSDALRSLLEAVALVTEGQAEARCSWEEEPGEYRFVLRRDGNDVALSVLGFDELRGRPDEEGTVIFLTRQSVLRVARVILAAAQKVLDDVGLDGYREMWVQHEFPSAALERLRRALSA